jgi:hypothetical protein
MASMTESTRPWKAIVAAVVSAFALLVVYTSVTYWRASPSPAALQYLAGEVFKASLGFLLVVCGGAMIKGVVDTELDKRKTEREWQSKADERRRSELAAWEERKRLLLQELARIFSGFYTVRKLHHSITKRQAAPYQNDPQEVEKVKRGLLRECVELEGRYGALKVQALLLLHLPAGDLGWKNINELTARLASTTDPRQIVRLRFDVLGEAFDGWRHALEKGDRITTGPQAWAEYEFLLGHLTSAQFVAAPPCE